MSISFKFWCILKLLPPSMAARILKIWQASESQSFHTYLISSWFMWCHVTFKLSSVCKGVTAQGATKVIFILFMAILNVFFQRGKAFIASITIWAGEQLGKCIWCSCKRKIIYVKFKTFKNITKATTESLCYVPDTMLPSLYLILKIIQWYLSLFYKRKKARLRKVK